jgi:talin
MFATQGAPGSGGFAGAGVGGVGGVGAGVGVPTSPPVSSGSGGSPAGSQREDNLDDLAQKELLEATRVIEMLAAQLASRPRKAPPRTAETEHLEITTEEISDAIMDGAQAIARAASALMRAAALAQEERVKLNTHRSATDGSPYHADPVWANGLISAARNVVATTQYLVSTSNAAANGQAGEETLVASARAVGAATAHLVAAQKAKGDVNSQASRELDDAARGIARATAALVEAAKLASTPAPAPAQTSAVPDKYTMTDKQIREIEAQTKLLQLEKETQRAREELLNMRKQEYKG